jgi:hypothetical protein
LLRGDVTATGEAVNTFFWSRFASAVTQIRSIYSCCGRSCISVVAIACARAGRVACFDVSVGKKKKKKIHFQLKGNVLNKCSNSILIIEF